MRMMRNPLTQRSPVHLIFNGIIFQCIYYYGRPYVLPGEFAHIAVLHIWRGAAAEPWDNTNQVPYYKQNRSTPICTSLSLVLVRGGGY